MAKQAGVGALLLPESQGHVRVRNIIDTMCSGPKQQGFHDSRHVARDAAATVRFIQMMGVLLKRRLVLKLNVTLQAHLIRLVAELQRGGVRGGIRWVGVMAVPASHLPLFEAR